MRLLGHLSHNRSARSLSAALLGLLFGSQIVSAIDLDLSSTQSIKDAASTTAYGLMAWYNGNKTGGIPGNLPQPFFWWECGAVMMSMIDYWFYTGDSSYNKVVSDAILWQTGPNADFMTPNQTLTEGNDDQAFWAFAALEAAELAFPNPPKDKPSWIALAQNVFNLQTTRIEYGSCGGGLRWQIFPFNAGFNYKNGISNGCYFSMGARIARYTNNHTYAVMAEQMWDWVWSVGLMDHNYNVFDGTDLTINCTQINHLLYTYNAGVFLHGAATMWNFTQDDKWKTRVDGLVSSLNQYFPDKKGVMVETQCQPQKNCNNDQQTFKAYLARWMAVTTQLAPWTADKILPLLKTSAAGAAVQCSGGSGDASQPGQTCGMDWGNPKWDGMYGPGEQMAAMQVIAANLIGPLHGPYTENDGGLSKSDPNAGSKTTGDTNPFATRRITAGDRAGAAFVTLFFALSFASLCVWASMQ